MFRDEYWNDVAKRNWLWLLNYADINQALLYGRSFIKLNILDGQLNLEIIDPQDNLIGKLS